MASPKKRLKAQLENAKNKAKNAADKVNYEISLNKNKGLKGEELTSGAGYNAADYALKLASADVRRLQNLYDNYKEPEKAKTETEQVLDAETKRIDDLVKGVVPDTTTASTTGTDISVGTAPADRDIAKEQAAAAKFLYEKDDPTKKAIADRLGQAGYKVSNWKSIEELTSRYQEALTGNQQRNTALGINQTLDEFINTKKAEQVGSGVGGPEVDVTISSESAAASTIQSVVKGILNRDATAAEITNLTKALNKAERSAGRKTRKIGGRTEYTTDLDRVQFLTEEVKKIKDPKSGKSEFEVKQGEKESLTSQELMAVARANGIDLSQDQINSYLTNIRNGRDLDVVKNDIRAAAGLGRPDNIKKLLLEGTDLETIYAPYKRTMASILELDPASIDINDSTLQTAIGDKELPIYEFRKLLKKDPRCQYTNNSREEVSSKALRVLRDFGFQG